MTRKERQAVNGIGSQQNAKGHNRQTREERFKPLKSKEEIKPKSLTEKLGIEYIKNIDKEKK